MQMKQQLRHIYDDLSSGRVSQQEALESIKAMKLQEARRGTGALLVTPVWQTSGVELTAGAGQIEYAEHHVVLCELSTIDVETLRSVLPRSRCLPLQAGQQGNIAQRYSEHALACFERIQSVLRSRSGDGMRSAGMNGARGRSCAGKRCRATRVRPRSRSPIRVST
jgi:hypothetical protein